MRGSDRRQEGREREREQGQRRFKRREEGEKRCNELLEKHLLHTFSWDIHPPNTHTHSSPTLFLSQFPSNTQNLTLHWFAVQCGRQATTCERNYSYREGPGERKGGRDRSSRKSCLQAVSM